jgi:hypothetical protein
MEAVLNTKPIGNLNRQFVSLLRSEQESANPQVGHPDCWATLLGPEATLTTLDEAFLDDDGNRKPGMRRFPFLPMLKWMKEDPTVIPPGILFLWELCTTYLRRGYRTPDRSDKLAAESGLILIKYLLFFS